jgi:hypothetical protein
MSNHLAIATVTAALRQIVFEEAQSTVGVPMDVTVGRPTNQGNGASVFLYQTLPNAAMRNMDLPSRSASGARTERPVLAIELRYLLSFWGDLNTHLAQRLMGAVMTRLHSRPVLQPAAIRALLMDPNLNMLAGSNLADQVELVRFSPVALSLEDLSKVWSTMLQTPYAVSAAYSASVVLLEAEEQLAPGLPVLSRTVTAIPFKRPRIERVLPAADPAGQITAETRVIVEGHNLRDELTEVRLATQPIVPVEARDRRVIFDLPAGLDIGPHALWIEHPRMLGLPPVQHRGVQSTVVPLVLHPRIAVDAAGDPRITVTPIGARRQIDLLIVPQVRNDQKVELELLDDTGVVRYRVSSAPIVPDRTDSLRFEVEAVPGVYRVRVRVDWAESPLWIDNRPASPTAGQLLPRFSP